MKQPILLQTVIYVDMVLPEKDVQEALSLINYHYTGDRECNKIDDAGKYVPKYTEIEKQHPEWINSHYQIRRTMRIPLQVDVFLDGTFGLSKKQIR